MRHPQAPDAAPAGPRTLLVTGFGPFLDVRENPSWEAIRDLDGARLGATVVRRVRLDVRYDAVGRQLDEALCAHAPDRVLALGVCRDPALRLEHVARNLDAASAPDVSGESRPGRVIVEGGPDTLESRLPLARMRRALEQGGFEVLDSRDAGGYLCNHLFYELLTRFRSGPAGFVHVPPLTPPWDLGRLRRAVWTLIETLAAA